MSLGRRGFLSLPGAGGAPRHDPATVGLTPLAVTADGLGVVVTIPA